MTFMEHLCQFVSFSSSPEPAWSDQEALGSLLINFDKEVALHWGSGFHPIYEGFVARHVERWKFPPFKATNTQNKLWGVALAPKVDPVGFPFLSARKNKNTVNRSWRLADIQEIIESV